MHEKRLSVKLFSNSIMTLLQANELHRFNEYKKFNDNQRINELRKSVLKNDYKTELSNVIINKPKKYSEQ